MSCPVSQLAFSFRAPGPSGPRQGLRRGRCDHRLGATRGDDQLRLWVKQCEASYLDSLLHRPTGTWCHWESDRYGQGTEGGRNSSHKDRINSTLAAAVRHLMQGCSGGGQQRQEEATALVLDGSTAGTSRALMEQAGFQASNIYVPNPHTHVVSSLKRQHRVSAFACRLEGYLRGRPPTLPGHRLVFLDLTASVQSHEVEIAAAADVLDPAGSVLAVTVSSRGMGDSWGRADALHSAITGCMRAAAARGLELSGLGTPWMGDYVLYGPPTDEQPGSLAGAVVARDLRGMALALERWCASLEAQDAPERLRTAAAKAAARALSTPGGGAVRGALWMPQAGRGQLFAVLGWTGRDDEARAVLSLAKSVCGWRAKQRLGPGAGAAQEAEAEGRPAGATVLEGCAVLYVGQMMTIAFKASRKSAPSAVW